jgi:ribosome-binding protein aMBF1 (putative translation factor)
MGWLDSLLGGSVKPESMEQCKHCGRFFNVKESDGYKTSMELFTCDYCYRDGKRDWATDYHDENTF